MHFEQHYKIEKSKIGFIIPDLQRFLNIHLVRHRSKFKAMIDKTQTIKEKGGFVYVDIYANIFKAPRIVKRLVPSKGWDRWQKYNGIKLKDRLND